MGKRPYYIEDDEHKADLEGHVDVLAEFLDRFKEILFKDAMSMSTYHAGIATQIYGSITALSKFHGPPAVSPLDIDPVVLAYSIARSIVRSFENVFQTNEALLSVALFKTLSEIAEAHRPIYHKEKAVSSQYQLGQVAVEAQIGHHLEFYSIYFNGPYRSAIVFQSIIWRLQLGRQLDSKTVDAILTQDVSKVLDDFRSVAAINEQYELCSFCVEPHLRNALAHNGVCYREDHVTLQDRDWTTTLDHPTSFLYMRNIRAVYLGMQLGFWMLFIKYQKQMNQYVQPTYDEDQIRQVLYGTAKDFGFILDNLTTLEFGQINMRLVKLGRSGENLKDETTVAGNITVNTAYKIERSSRNAAIDFAQQALSVLNGYHYLEIDLSSFGGGTIKSIRIDLECLRNRVKNHLQIEECCKDSQV